MAKTPKEPRKLKTPEYRSFRLQKSIKAADPLSLPSSFKILSGALGVLKQNWKPFLGIVLVYGLLNLILVQSFSNGDLSETKNILDGFSTGQWAGLGSSFALFVYMAGSSGNLTSEVAGAYQLMLTVVTSLALIWTLRQVYASKKVRVRDGFYRGMYPLVPFVLVLIAVGLQLTPVILGAFLYNLASTSGIAAGGVEILLWLTVFFLLALLSLYMLCSSLLALYIVCLPDVEPMTALRTARDLVRFRRWTIMRRIIFLPIFLLIAAMLFLIPLIYVAASIAGFAFFVVSMLGLPIIHAYMYRLYRELL